MQRIGGAQAGRRDRGEEGRLRRSQGGPEMRAEASLTVFETEGSPTARMSRSDRSNAGGAFCDISGSGPAGEPLLAPEAIELLVAPRRLAVFAILDLDPWRPPVDEIVGGVGELGDDAFEVTLHDLGEEVHAAPMDMGQELHAGSPARDDSTQHPLPLYER